MGPNDQYPYYYGSNATNPVPQNDLNANYNQSRATTTTNQYNQQHSRQASSTTPAQSYNYQQPASYATNQTSQYNQPAYYGTGRDGGTRAAETLSRMGSTATNPATTATSYGSVNPPNSYGTNYNSQYPSSSTLQNASTCATSSYGTAAAQQARPSSVNSARSAAATRSPIVEPMQQPARPNVNAQYHRTQLANVASVQRSASPAQIQASHQLQRLADQRNQEAQAIPQNNQQSFVDPSAVYDPWPEYQRKLAAAQAAKDVEDRLAADREAADKKREEENEEERAAAEEAEKQLQEEEEKERKKAEAARKRAEKKATADPAAPKKKRKSKGAVAEEASAGNSVSGLNLAQLTAMAGAAPAGSDAEAQIRSLMAMVKQMNDKHPDLLAKIWEEERQQHLEKGTDSPAEPADGASGTSNKKKKKTPKKTVPTANGGESSRDAAQAPASGATVSGKGKATPATSTPSTTAASASVKPAAKGNNTSRGTIWPPEKKGQIAAAAVRWLSSLPGNPGRPPVTTQQIASMLDRNPTYIELCEMIEKLGFKVERAAFAKALLTSVPDVNANRSAASPAVPRPPSTGPFRIPATPATVAPGSFVKPAIPTAQSPILPLSSGMPNYASPYFDARGEQIPTESASKSKDKKEKKRKAPKEKDGSADVDSNAPDETPGPVTKADAARKRTFADLVDLTALSDDDDYPPAKHAYFGPQVVTQPGQAYSTQLDFLPDFNQNNVIDPHLQRSVDRFGPSQQQSLPSLEKQQMMNIANKLNTVDLAKQIDKKNALRRSRYDVRTLARDVLLATGKHPDLLPLNGHLEGLRSIFANSINFNSDLATLRWDLMDAGEPIPEALAMVIHDDNDSVIDDADDESEEEVRHFAVRAPSRTQSIAVNAGAGASGSPGASIMHMDSPSATGFGVGKLIPSRGRGRPRGRPAGLSRFSTSSAQTPIGNHRPPAPVPSSASPATGSPGGAGYSAFARDTRPDGTKRRGRPVGWRKAIHQRGVGVEAGGLGYAYASERKATAPAQPPPATDPKFTIYKCRWENCSAELHNLQTLRKHVNKKHGVADRTGKFTCLWKQCDRQVQNIDATGAVVQSMQHFNYPGTGELMTHVEHRHIQPIGWELGDGPPGGFSDSNASDAEAYLSDRQGRRVTPTILAAPPNASAGISAQRTPGQRGRPPKKTDEEKARESQAELARNKREIGLGVDRGGATFANEKRRAGFVDDEDEDEVLVDASD